MDTELGERITVGVNGNATDWLSSFPEIPRARAHKRR